ncbi:MAG: 16S rRNA processing protein RimM [Clostridia bacterium]|nr:16S rRNA processing protein RimM [Clostridia bacterium]
MREKLRIGLIVKPHGVRGEVKVYPLTDEPQKFSRLKKATVDGKEFALNSVKVGTDAVYVSFCGVPDRNAAELLRGKYVEMDRADDDPAEEFSYYVSDIVGSTVILDNGETVGKVTDVTSAKTDIFTVVTENGKTVRFPFLKSLIISFDEKEKVLKLFAARFKEVAFYED